ncbi:hypothetical protein B0H67DRAFT_175690 [Lasiosphaeris hirsuta]|uniref:Secreted protein n=1 Tax=Lasiosphaeris hirsuta TaxID=260670 RepID=A0AA40AQC7_9PEZI|nr:hypothetical protein B0H67DRAFT_175690 [Lasiosphaeris hirsuta]
MLCSPTTLLAFSVLVVNTLTFAFTSIMDIIQSPISGQETHFRVPIDCRVKKKSCQSRHKNTNGRTLLFSSCMVWQDIPSAR